jgi:hypothetical protein
MKHCLFGFLKVMVNEAYIEKKKIEVLGQSQLKLKHSVAGLFDRTIRVSGIHH